MYKVGDMVRLSDMRTAWGRGHADMGGVGVITRVIEGSVNTLFATPYYDIGETVDRSYYVSWDGDQDGYWRGAEHDLVLAGTPVSDSVPCPPSLRKKEAASPKRGRVVAKGAVMPVRIAAGIPFVADAVDF